MSELDIQILPTDTIAPELNQAIDAVSNSAFQWDHEEAGPDDVDWSSHIDWMVVGSLERKPVTVLCLLKREILVGGQKIWVAGIGGVATHPDWQHRGFATQILRTADRYMREAVGVPFGLLVCADETRPVYEKLGWLHIAHSLIFHQAGQARTLDTAVLILPLADQDWPAGEIDVCGPPW